MQTQTDQAEQGRQLDQLIPPPWPRARIVAVGVAVLGVAVLLAAAWGAGLLGPRLERPFDGNSRNLFAPPDGELVAATRVQLRNAGRLPVEIRAFAPPELDGIEWHPVAFAPPELDGIEWHPAEPALPVTLQRGESVVLWVAFTAQSCAVDGGGLKHFPLLARSGLLPARVVAVPHGPGLGHRGDLEPSWVSDMITRCTEVSLDTL